MLKVIVVIFLAVAVNSQYCLDHEGSPVQWWVILKTPPKIGNNGFAYYDSRTKRGQFLYHETKVDVESSALSLTIKEFNEKGYQVIAWNDEKPSGSTSSTSAHSKGFIGFSIQNGLGFFVTHSIPKYPQIENQIINPEIQISQQVYGQHIMCFTLTLKQLNDIASKLLIIRPNVYTDPVRNTPNAAYLYTLSTNKFSQTSELFQYYDFRSLFGYGIKSIFKHHSLNGSIFEDGLTRYLSVSPLIAETWGRPLQPAWCSQNSIVKNVKEIKIDEYSWFEADDHSKWLLANEDFACFGDMNRMSSQWKRGGAFYCLTDVTLIKAVKKIIISYDSCPETI